MVKIWPLTRRRDCDQHDDGLTHTTCCVDDDIAVCGVDVSDVPWVEEGGLDCVVCEDLVRSDFCPNGLTCIWGPCE